MKGEKLGDKINTNIYSETTPLFLTSLWNFQKGVFAALGH